MFVKQLGKFFSTRLWKYTEIALFVFLTISLINIIIVFQYSIELTLLMADRASAATRKYLNDSLINGTLAIIIFCFLGIVKASSIYRDYILTRRYRNLANTMLKFAKGNISVRFEDNSEPEINVVGSAFNKMADSLQNLIEELKTSEKKRKEITSHIAHDLAGPVTAILGNLDRLRNNSNKMSEDEKQNYFQTIKNNLNTLSKLIANLTDLSKLEIDEIPIQCETFSLRVLIYDIISRYAIEAEKKSIRLFLEEGSSEAMISADITMLERVLSNLIENALKYTPVSCQIKLSCSENLNKTSLVIEDNGIGIPEEDLPFVFERFYRVDKDRSRDSGGSGLGLAIVKKVINLHNGSIKISSNRNKGTKITIELNSIPVSC